MGFVHIYTGNGKGKTTAALGLGLRAVGAGKKVLLIQFLKAEKPGSSELKVIKKIPNFSFKCFGRSILLTKKNVLKKDKELAEKGIDFARKSIQSGKFDLVILDEINVALTFKLLSLQEITDLIKNKPKNVELVLTGRYASKQLLEIADLVTEMKEKKHYFSKGVKSRKGIEK